MRRERDPRQKLFRRAAAAFLFLCSLAWASSAIATGEGITGKVVNGTRGGPVAGIEVTLQLARGQSDAGSQTTKTDSAGAFSFTGIGTDATDFRVGATYRGVDYWSKVVPLAGGKAPAPITLKVYETTTSPENVTQADWVVWVDREGNGVAVQHDIRWDNSGNTTYVGSDPAGDGRQVVTEVPLAPGAKDFQYLGTFLETPGFVRGTTFVHTQPIVPGQSSATLRYSTGSLSTLSIPVTLPTTSFSLFVPDGITVTSDRLTSAGTKTDQGIPYHMFTASDLAAGDTIDVSLSGLGSKSSPLTIVLAAAGVLAAVGAFAAWRLSRARFAPRARTPRTRSSPGRHPVQSRTAPKLNGSRARAPRVGSRPARAKAPGKIEPEAPGDDQAELLVDEIAALDLAFDRGFLDQRTYQSLRTATKNRLLRLRSETAGEGTEE